MTPQLNIANVIGLPTGAGITVPQAATPDFAALFASVAVAPSGEGTVPAVTAEPVKFEPVVPLLANETESAVPVALSAPAQLAKVPAPIRAVGSQKPGAVAPLTDEARSKASAGAIGTDVPTDVSKSLSLVVDPLIIVDAIMPPVTEAFDQNAATEIAPVVDGSPVTQPLPKRIAAPEVSLPDVPLVANAASVVVEFGKRTASAITERTELSVAPVGDMRPTTLIAASDKLVMPVADRIATFAPIIADVARDMIAIAQDKDVRFNVRPDILGPVAVTIERTDAGPTLRLGVETQAAVQAVRQAESTMNDARGSAQFVQVTVDMNAPDSRGRSPRTMPPPRTVQDDVSEQMQLLHPAATGRYA